MRPPVVAFGAWPSRPPAHVVTSATASGGADGDAQLWTGGEDGGIYRWETQSGKALRTLNEHHYPVGAIKCNPTRMMIASADSAVSLWLPS